MGQKTLKVRQKHTAKATIQVTELTKAGTSIELDLFADEEKLGRLIIGRGSLTWFRKNAETPTEKWTWSRFAHLLDG